MSVLKVFSVFDSGVGAYMRPFYDVARGAALRSFCDIAQDTTSAIGKHPQDFTLFELGEYDDSNATFNLHKTPVSLGLAIEMLAVK